jgi:multisubunit Na+/H+ antiporter MnhG subunit
VIGGLVWAAVAIELAACVGLVVAGSHHDRLHYASLAAVLPPMLLAAAVALEQGAAIATWNAILVAVMLLLVNAVLSHATARVARRRGYGDVQALPEERNA